MTVAILYLSSPYAFVAADQRFSSWIIRDGERLEVRGEEVAERPEGPWLPFVKVRAHPTRPVVWVCAGPGKVPYQGEQASVDDLIEDALAKVPGPLSKGVGRALEFLGPLVVEEMALDPESFEGAPDPGLTVLLGIHEAGSAGGVSFHFGKQSHTQGSADHAGFAAISRHTKSFFDGLPKKELWPPPDSTSEKVVTHLRDLLSRAIKAAEVIAGEAADVGGHIDVAMVGPEGARLLPP
jgi:hypothetical protein